MNSVLSMANTEYVLHNYNLHTISFNGNCIILDCRNSIQFFNDIYLTTYLERLFGEYFLKHTSDYSFPYKSPALQQADPLAPNLHLTYTERSKFFSYVKFILCVSLVIFQSGRYRLYE